MERREILLAAVAGVLVGLLFWLDPLYFPLVLVGPLLSGLVLGWRGEGWRALALAWAVAGVFALVSDWIANNEDKLFHLAVAVFLVAWALLWWAVGRFAGRRLRRRSAEPARPAPG